MLTSLPAPFTFSEAGIWIQIFLRLFHRDFFNFWLDIDGASFWGASIIQFLDMQGKERWTNSAETRPLDVGNYSASGDGPDLIFLYNSYYSSSPSNSWWDQNHKALKNSVRMGYNKRTHLEKTVTQSKPNVALSWSQAD